MKKDIKLLLKKLNLSLERITSSRKNVFFTALCKDSKENQLVFKMQLNKNKKIKERFEREYTLTKILSENKKIFPFESPTFINGSTRPDRSWLLRTYLEGVQMGSYYQGFNKKLLIGQNPMFFINIIESIQNDLQKLIFSNSARKFNNVKKHVSKWYKNEIINNCRKINNYNIKIKIDISIIKDIKKIINKNEFILDQECRYLSHGDLFPSNFIINKDKKITVFDWEELCIDNSMMDFAYVWVSLKNDKSFQNSFLKAVQKNNKNKNFELFYIDLLYLTSHIIYTLFFYFFKNKKTVQTKEQIEKKAQYFYNIFRESLNKINSTKCK